MGKAIYSILLIAHFKKKPSKPVVKLHQALSNKPSATTPKCFQAKPIPTPPGQS